MVKKVSAKKKDSVLAKVTRVEAKLTTLGSEFAKMAKVQKEHSRKFELHEDTIAAIVRILNEHDQKFRVLLDGQDRIIKILEEMQQERLFMNAAISSSESQITFHGTRLDRVEKTLDLPELEAPAR